MKQYLNNPAIKFNLSECHDYTYISHVMKEHGIINYVYCFETEQCTIKYGMSADKTGMHGERVYRQAGHLPGWKNRLSGSSGSDMRIICDDYKSKYGIELNRNMVTLTVLDMTNLDPEDECWPDLVCKEVERYFINEHVKDCGVAPIGNKDTETKLVERQERNKKQLGKLFDFE